MKKIILFTTLLYLLAGASTAHAQEASAQKEPVAIIDVARERFIEIRNKVKDTINNIAETEKQELLDRGKDFLTQLSAKAEQTVANAKATVQSSDNLPQDTKDNALVDLDAIIISIETKENHIDEITEIQDIISTAENISLDVKSAQDVLKELKFTSLSIGYRRIVDDSKTIYERFQSDSIKLERAGQDTTSLNVAIDAYGSSLGIADVNTSSLESQGDDNSLVTAKQSISDLEESYKDVLRVLKQIYDNLEKETGVSE